MESVSSVVLQVKYRMAGGVARTICHVDEKAMDIEHAKKVSQQVSKVSDCWLSNTAGSSGYWQKQSFELRVPKQHLCNSLEAQEG